MICIRVYQDKAKYNKELAHALQNKANMVTEAIKGLAENLLQVCMGSFPLTHMTYHAYRYT